VSILGRQGERRKDLPPEKLALLDDRDAIAEEAERRGALADAERDDGTNDDDCDPPCGVHYSLLVCIALSDELTYAQRSVIIS
jgi:hypothetical protein